MYDLLLQKHVSYLHVYDFRMPVSYLKIPMPVAKGLLKHCESNAVLLMNRSRLPRGVGVRVSSVLYKDLSSRFAGDFFLDTYQFLPLYVYYCSRRFLSYFHLLQLLGGDKTAICISRYYKTSILITIIRSWALSLPYTFTTTIL